jgi:hypothetical protein
MNAGALAADPDIIIEGEISAASRMPAEAIGRDLDDFDN